MSKRNKQNVPLVPCHWLGCFSEWGSELELNDHIATHLTIKFADKGMHKCAWDKCKYITECYKEFQRHMFYHGYYNRLLVLGKYECDQNPSIPRCNNAILSVKFPELKTDFKCEWIDCERTFISIVEFHDHIVQHASFEYEIQKSPEDLRPKIYCKWNFCRKQLDNKYRLIEHIRTHSNKKQVACYHCGELFRTKTTLFDHLRRQRDNNTHKYQCAQCFKYFATEKLLRSHVVKHVNCYKCSMCDMTCASASSLAMHFRYRHLKDKPFKCTECDHRCVNESDLVKHIQFVHTKEMHHCDHPGCSYSVLTYHSLRRHFLEMHENIPFIYICHCCDKPFKNGKSLSSHLIKKHSFQLPSGHKRFTYRMDENGFYRLETERIESIEVTKQVLPNSVKRSEITQDNTCYQIISNINGKIEQNIVSDTDSEVQMLGEVIISIPSINHV